jgi:hypothetical protein
VLGEGSERSLTHQQRRQRKWWRRATSADSDEDLLPAVAAVRADVARAERDMSPESKRLVLPGLPN